MATLTKRVGEKVDVEFSALGSESEEIDTIMVYTRDGKYIRRYQVGKRWGEMVLEEIEVVGKDGENE